MKINKYITILDYDKEMFNFEQIIKKHFNKKFRNKIEDLHKKNNYKDELLLNKIKSPIHKLKDGYFDVKNDQANILTKYFYKIDPYFQMRKKKYLKKGKFIKLYIKLLFFLQNKYFKEKIIIQKKPTLRIHLPERISVGGYHRDSDYGHPKENINCWLPFNDAFQTATLWLEREPYKQKFKPVNVKYGQILIFDSRLKHGVEVNKENYTRYSMDFRVQKKKDYKPSNKTSPKNKIKFSIGGYFFDINNL